MWGAQCNRLGAWMVRKLEKEDTNIDVSSIFLEQLLQLLLHRLRILDSSSSTLRHWTLVSDSLGVFQAFNPRLGLHQRSFFF